MTIDAWRKMTPTHQAEVWPTLTHAERDMIIESDKDALRALLPADYKPAAWPEKPAPASGLHYVLSPKSPPPDCEGVLAEARSHTSYGFLRGFTSVVTFAGLLASLLLALVWLAHFDEPGPRWSLLVWAVSLFFGSIAWREASLLLIDLVDLQLLQEARRRAGQPKA